MFHAVLPQARLSVQPGLREASRGARVPGDQGTVPGQRSRDEGAFVLEQGVARFSKRAGSS